MSNQHPDYDIKEEAPDNDDLSSAVSRGYDDITNVYGVLEKDRKDADTNKQERKKQDTEARGKLNKMLLRFCWFHSVYCCHLYTFLCSILYNP